MQLVCHHWKSFQRVNLAVMIVNVQYKKNLTIPFTIFLRQKRVHRKIFKRIEQIKNSQLIFS